MKVLLGIFVFCVLLVSCQTVSIPVEPARSQWTFSSGEEDWGPTVYISNSNQGSQAVTILSDASTFKPVMLLSGYKPEYGTTFLVEVVVDSRKVALLEGSLSDYFGEIAVSGLSKDTLELMKSGEVLSLKIGRDTSRKLSLSGSSNAITKFLGNF